MSDYYGPDDIFPAVEQAEEVVDDEGEAAEAHARRSAAPSPIDTNIEGGGTIVAFDVREYESRNAPLIFLDCYTQKHKGWPNIRSRPMIPEKYIERVPFKSPCLHYGPIDTPDDNADHANHADQPEQPKAAIEVEDDTSDDSEHDILDHDETDWTKDPSYIHFMHRLDQQAHLRKHIYHPVSKWSKDNDCKDCVERKFTQGHKLPRPEKPTESDWINLRERYSKALHDLDIADLKEDRQCPVCHQSFKSILTEDTSTVHWAFHRYNYLQGLYDEKSIRAEAGEEWTPTLAESLEQLKDGKIRDQFCYQETMCHLAENEILEREEYCRICYHTFAYGKGLLAEHYRAHHDQEKKQKDVATTLAELNTELVEDGYSRQPSPTTAVHPRVKAATAAMWREAKASAVKKCSHPKRTFVASDFPTGLVNAAVGGGPSSRRGSKKSSSSGRSSKRDSPVDVIFSLSNKRVKLSPKHRRA